MVCKKSIIIKRIQDLLIRTGYLMNEIKRSDIKAGMQVKIVTKYDQRTGKLTGGIIKDILTKSPKHPHGIKVRLETGEVGRVKEILE